MKSSEPSANLEPASPAAPNGDFLRTDDLRKRIGRQDVLRGVTINVRRGETLVLVGQSGEGKSVFLKHILGLMQPDSGRIVVDGIDISQLGERALGPVREKIGILFQNGALFDSLTVEENVAFPLRESGLRDEDEIRRRVHDSLDRVGLAEHKTKMPISLSGGMRKRVALARAIITRPACILYDEPTAGLDPIVSDSIDRLIRRLQKSLAVTSVVVTHDMKCAFFVGDRIAFLRQGTIHFLGTPDEFRRAADPLIRRFVEGSSEE